MHFGAHAGSVAASRRLSVRPAPRATVWVDQTFYQPLQLSNCATFEPPTSHLVQDAVERMRTDQETKRELFEQVTALQAAAGGGGGPVAVAPAPTVPGSPSELGSLLAAERRRTADLQKVLFWSLAVTWGEDNLNFYLKFVLKLKPLVHLADLEHEEHLVLSRHKCLLWQNRILKGSATFSPLAAGRRRCRMRAGASWSCRSASRRCRRRRARRRCRPMPAGRRRRLQGTLGQFWGRTPLQPPRCGATRPLVACGNSVSSDCI